MGRWSRVVARSFVPWLEVEGRAHWLDVGCGTGALTEAICELGNPASVVACDPSGPFIETASSTLPDKRVAFELAGAEHLPDRDGGFDVIVSGLVLNFLADPERALANMRRRLSPRGFVAVYVWDYTEGVELLRRFWDAATEVDPRAAVVDERRRFGFCNPEGLARLFRAADLGSVHWTRFTVPTPFASFDEIWQPLLGRTGAAPSYVASLDPEQRERLRQRLEPLLTCTDGSPRALTASAWAFRGAPLDAASA